MSIDNKLIGWQSLEGSTCRPRELSTSARRVGALRVRVRLQYNPPAGKLWAAIAWLFGEEPTMQIQEDLQRFKQLMETGKISENRLNG